MNQRRRKDLERIAAHLEAVKGEELDTLLGEEQEALDNMPEGLAGSERAERMEAAISAMEQAAESLEDAAAYLIEAAEG